MLLQAVKCIGAGLATIGLAGAVAISMSGNIETILESFGAKFIQKKTKEKLISIDSRLSGRILALYDHIKSGLIKIRKILIELIADPGLIGFLARTFIFVVIGLVIGHVFGPDALRHYFDPHGWREVRRSDLTNRLTNVDASSFLENNLNNHNPNPNGGHPPRVPENTVYGFLLLLAVAVVLIGYQAS